MSAGGIDFLSADKDLLSLQGEIECLRHMLFGVIRALFDVGS